jgi:hypothetical protein
VYSFTVSYTYINLQCTTYLLYSFLSHIVVLGRTNIFNTFKSLEKRIKKNTKWTVNTNCGAVDAWYGVLETQKIFGSNQNKPKQNLFRLCFNLFRANKQNSGLFWLVLVCFGLFRYFDPISKQPKQTEIFLKIPKSALYQNVSIGLLFVSVQSKQGNSLFHYRSKTTEINCFETNRNNPKFLKNTNICSLSNWFGWSSVCFSSI